MIDSALLVVSAPSTPYPMVQRAAQAIGAGRSLGVVLNRAEHPAVPVYDDGSPGYAPARPHDRSGRWWRWLRKSNRLAVPRPSAASSAAEQSLG